MKVSEVIKTLQDMQKAYGDLNVTISIDKNPLSNEADTVITSEVLYFGYDQFEEKPNEINIRSFPY